MGNGFMKRIVSTDDVNWYSFRKARIGMFSAYNFDDKVTYIDTDYAINYNGVYDLIGYHVSKAMEDVRFSKGKRGELVAPMYAVPSRSLDAYYIDIKSAYRTIASRWGAETLWDDEKPLAIGETKFHNEIYDNKLARGMIISLTTKERREQIWENNQLTTTVKNNYRYAPSLHNAVYSTLHAIMRECFPFMYANTDGIICHSFQLLRIVKKLEKYGLSYGIKDSGMVRIDGVGAYSFNYKVVRRNSHGFFSNLVDKPHPRILSIFRELKE